MWITCKNMQKYARRYKLGVQCIPGQTLLNYVLLKSFVHLLFRNPLLLMVQKSG